VSVGLYEYVGAVHVHTAFSDGEGAISEVIAAARAAGLDFLIITDHNDLRAREYEGWHGGTLVLAGEEVTRPGGNHMLALGITELIPPDVSPQEGIDAAKAQGGLAFVAHPFYQGSPIIDDPPLPWRDWSVERFDGIEVWNLTADLHQLLGERGLERPPGEVLGYAAPNIAALRKWDELLARGRVVGLGGLDAHAERVARWGDEVILPYEKAFRALRVHLLLRERLQGVLDADRSLIYRSLAAGNFFVGFDYLCPAAGTAVVALTDEGAIPPGEGLSPGGEREVELRVSLPYAGHILLIKGGMVVSEAEGEEVSFRIAGAGPYRVEVYREGRHWIIANPIYLR